MKQYIQPLIFIIGLIGGLALLSILNIAYPIRVTTSSVSSELSVVGEGKVEATPDVAFINTGISVSSANTAQDAQNQMNKVNNAIIDSLKRLGIEKEHIQTSDYSVYPIYDYESGGNEITGYTGNATVRIKTNDIEQVSDIIQAATEAGANQINGTSFSVEDPAKYREEARQKAIDNAKEQAQSLANELGIKLGKVTNIVESSTRGGSPIYPMAEQMRSFGGVGAGGGGPDIEPGQQEIHSTVTLYFEKK